VGASRRLAGPVIVAGDDSDDVHSAMQTAQQLARRDGVAAFVVGAVTPLAIPPGMLSDVDRRALDEARRQQYHDRLRQRVARAVGVSGHFAVDVALGRRSTVLAREARTRAAAVMLAGIGRLGAEARVPTEDATVQLVLESDVPVLAVPAGSSLLPRRCLVALDFGSASQVAARAALLMLDGPSTVILAHVHPPMDDDDSGWRDAYDQQVARMLAETAAQLARAGGITVETVHLRGDPAAALLNAARAAVVDLVACGVEGASSDVATPDILAVRHAGGTSLALIHRAPCSVLVAPPETAPVN
jgi:nucleotide-binding universal stress UspA family protein